MKVQIFDSSRVLVVLSREEAQALGLGGALSWNSLRCRLAAAHVFSEISRRYRLPLRNRRILLRASEVVSGETVLFFTLQKGRILRLAEKHLLAVYECCRADDLFRAAAVIGRLAASPGELYRWPSSQEGPCWRLIVPVTLGQYPALRCALGEYARFRGGGASYAAYTREHGILLGNRAAECLRPQ